MKLVLDACCLAILQLTLYSALSQADLLGIQDHVSWKIGNWYHAANSRFGPE